MTFGTIPTGSFPVDTREGLLIQHITLNLITFGFATAMEFFGLLLVLEKLVLPPRLS